MKSRILGESIFPCWNARIIIQNGEENLSILGWKSQKHADKSWKSIRIQEISVKLCIGRSTVWRKIRTFEAENPELAEKMKKQGKEITPSDYKDLVKEIAELKKQLKTERLRADFYEEMVAFGKEVYGIDLKKAGTK